MYAYALIWLRLITPYPNPCPYPIKKKSDSNTSFHNFGVFLLKILLSAELLVLLPTFLFFALVWGPVWLAPTAREFLRLLPLQRLTTTTTIITTHQLLRPGQQLMLLLFSSRLSQQFRLLTSKAAIQAVIYRPAQQSFNQLNTAIFDHLQGAITPELRRFRLQHPPALTHQLQPPSTVVPPQPRAPTPSFPKIGALSPLAIFGITKGGSFDLTLYTSKQVRVSEFSFFRYINTRNSLFTIFLFVFCFNIMVFDF